MSLFDILAVTVLSVSLVFSLFRGLVREVFSLLAYIGGYFLAINFRENFAAIIYRQIPDKTASEIISFVLIFMGGVIAVSMVGKIARSLVRSTRGLTVLDRLLGGVVGVAKGALILIILMFPLKMFPDLHSNVTKDSFIAPHIINFSKTLSAVMMRNKKIFDKFPSPDLKKIKDGVREQFQTLKDFKTSAEKLTSKSADAAKEIEQFEKSAGKPQDDYTKEDKKQLNDILFTNKK